jgi:hypothetical protein
MKQKDSEPHLNEGVTAALIVLAAVVNPDVLRNRLKSSRRYPEAFVVLLNCSGVAGRFPGYKSTAFA